MTDPVITEAQRRARELGPSVALRTARPAPGYETTSRQPGPPDPAMLERHEHLTRRRGGAAGTDEGLELRRRELELLTLTQD